MECASINHTLYTECDRSSRSLSPRNLVNVQQKYQLIQLMMHTISSLKFPCNPAVYAHIKSAQHRMTDVNPVICVGIYTQTKFN